MDVLDVREVKTLSELCMDEILSKIMLVNVDYKDGFQKRCFCFNDEILQRLPFKLKIPEKYSENSFWEYSGNGSQVPKLFSMMQVMSPPHQKGHFLILKPSEAFQTVEISEIPRIYSLRLQCGSFTEEGDQNFVSFLGSLFQHSDEKLEEIAFINCKPSSSVKTALTELPGSVEVLAIHDSILPSFKKEELQAISRPSLHLYFGYNQASYESTLLFLKTLCCEWNTCHKLQKVCCLDDCKNGVEKFREIMKVWSESSIKIYSFTLTIVDLTDDCINSICDFVKNKRNDLEYDEFYFWDTSSDSLDDDYSQNNEFNFADD